ncbi:MAG TPA: ABC transporter permease [Solirubrobacteraceae bacterium]|nr:ABC transporter permease [Solirubrobacteraceae bacterium]
MSSATADVFAVDAPPAAAPPPSVLRSLLRTWEGRFGVGLGCAMLLAIFAGPLVAPFDPTQLSVGPPTQGPSADHLLGTDNLGRDVLSRFLHGGRLVLLIPLASVAIAVVLGAIPGVFAAYRGGRVDSVVTRSFDLLLTLPPLLVVLVVIGAAGSSSLVLAAIVGVVYAPRVGRIARGTTQSVVTADYVLAAQARGESTSAILFREIAPNIAGPLIADLALRLTYAVIFVATLNFLGLGAQPPSSDWGLTVATARGYLPVQPWATLVPAAGIAALSVAFNLVADALTRHVSRETPAQAIL